VRQHPTSKPAHSNPSDSHRRTTVTGNVQSARDSRLALGLTIPPLVALTARRPSWVGSLAEVVFPLAFTVAFH
jgi:hypothetical protein